MKALIASSPHRANHIYHVLDAVDFPLSLVHGLHSRLMVAPQRTRNRRSRTERYRQGQKTEMSFIIARSDLLAPTKPQVDSMVPYLRQVLREALGSAGHRVRLGNVHCVSAKRSWWTGSLKERIWERGGGGWMVGMVNVGKSSLFDAVFPKGRGLTVGAAPLASHGFQSQAAGISGILPPAPAETLYPPMPTVSHLPGTTAAPIRHQYGNGRGELVDLPGLPRAGFEEYVQPEHRPRLIMRRRINAKRQNIRPGQSFTISNLVRITPSPATSVFQVFASVPLPCYIMDTDKAIALANGSTPHIRGVARANIGRSMAWAGKFPVKWDATRTHAGPLISRSGIGLNPNNLPFVVLSCDVLIAGMGWVEIAVQVRKRDVEEWTRSGDTGRFPSVEVFTPFGKHIASRRPLSCGL